MRNMLIRRVESNLNVFTEIVKQIIVNIEFDIKMEVTIAA